MSTTNKEVNEANNEDNNEEVINSSEEYNPLSEIKDWEDLDLNTELLRGIYAFGFEKPSAIQSKAIKPLIEKRDIIAQAQSGTGKTATFTIGALANINIKNNNTQVLVLSPTKELTIQTAKVFESIGAMLGGLRVKTMYGGSNIDEGSSFSSKNTPHII